MPAGTITLNNNSTAVTGSGTAFAAELKANDFLVAVVGGVTYTLGVKSVDSVTALTLITAYGGPTTSGLAWTPVPNAALVGITAQIAADTARAIRGLNYDKQNWQQVYSASGNITVTLPDGSTYTGPSWRYLSDNMATKVGGVVPVAQGGTGANNEAAARQKLNAIGVGDFGLGGRGIILSDVNLGQANTGSIIFVNGGAGYWTKWGAGLKINYGDSHNFQIYCTGDQGTLITHVKPMNGTPQLFATHYNNLNTTKAADGTLKAASPVIKLFVDGRAETNDESEGATVERLAVGQYLITGILGMNSDTAWGGTDGGFDIPKDRNRQPLIWLDYEVNPDGSVLVKTYHRTYPDAPAFARNLMGVKDEEGNFIETVKNGDPIDIPADQFVSVRVEMPADSVWNLKQIAAEKAMKEAERLAVGEAAHKAAEEAQINPDQLES